MRQNVFPAPGPASTSTGPTGASIARRCGSVGAVSDSGASCVVSIIALGRPDWKLSCRRALRHHPRGTRRRRQLDGSPSERPRSPRPGARSLSSSPHHGFEPWRLARRAYENWRRLEAATETALLHVTGVLYVGPEGGEIVGGTLASARQHGIKHEILDTAALARRYPL